MSRQIEVRDHIEIQYDLRPRYGSYGGGQSSHMVMRIDSIRDQKSGRDYTAAVTKILGPVMLLVDDSPVSNAVTSIVLAGRCHDSDEKIAEPFVRAALGEKKIHTREWLFVRRFRNWVRSWI